MKARLFFAFGLLVLLCLPAGLALADNGPHGNYTPTTDACAGCHRAHTASAAMLLIDTVPNLCYSCHGSTGSGADTNVVDGRYTGTSEGGPDSYSLKAGGFVNAYMATSWPTTTATISTTVTSSHLVDGSTGTVWGNGPITTTEYAGLTNFSLSCVSCHNPHGGAGPSGGPTYRLLRSTLPITGAVSAPVTDETSKLYTISNDFYGRKSGDQYFGELYCTFGQCYGQVANLGSELSDWCSQCHTRYGGATNSSDTNDSGDPIFAYRHMTAGAPNCATCHMPSGPPWIPEPQPHGPVWGHELRCITCHVAHGTSASMSGYAGDSDFVPWPDDSTSPSGDNRSSLLRVDNRGTCQLCHGK